MLRQRPLEMDISMPSRKSGIGIDAPKNGRIRSLVGRLRRLDREVWQLRASVGARGEPVDRECALDSLKRVGTRSLNTTKCESTSAE